MELDACAVERLAAPVEFEEIFQTLYPRVARVIARVVQDRARAEELAVDVFLKYWRRPSLGAPATEGWLYRAAIRAGLDELRRRNRRTHYERLMGWARLVPTPEQIHAGTEEQARVQRVLSALPSRDAELLLLRSDGLSYQELAEALGLNAASVGTLLSRAQEAFRKRHGRLYGNR